MELSDFSLNVESLVSTTHSTDKDIEEAKAAIKSKEYEFANARFQKIRADRWPVLADDQKYEVIANCGVCALATSRLADAAELFLQALPYKPADEKARTNAALAHQLRGERERAFTEAAAVRRDFPKSGRAAAIWAQNAPEEFTVKQLISDVNEELLNDAELNVALSRRALDEEDQETAAKLAERAAAGKSDWAYPWLLLGQALMQIEVREGIYLDTRLRSDDEKKRLTKIEEIYTSAIDSARNGREIDSLAIGLVLRSTVRQLTGNKAGMRDDAEEAFKTDPMRFEIRRSYAELLLGDGRIDDAVAILWDIPAEQHDNGSRYLLAQALVKRDKEEDRQAALDLLHTIVTDNDSFAPPGFRSQAYHFALSVLKKGEVHKISGWLDEAVDLTDVERAALAARAEMFSDKLDQAKAIAKSASDLPREAIPRSSTVRLAEVLSDLGLFEEAFKLWDELTADSAPELWHRRYLEASFNTQKHGAFLRRCAELRATGVADSNLVQAEVEVLERYDLDAAISILRAHLAKHSDDLESRLKLSVIGYRTNRPELIDASQGSMPDVETVQPELGFTVVQVQKLCGDPNFAVEYAYRLSQLHPRSANAQRALLAALHPFGPKPVITKFEKVQVGAAVAYKEAGSPEVRWAVVQEGIPLAETEYIPPTHTLARKLLGLRVGEEFYLSEGGVQSRKATIVEIKDKYTHRYQNILHNWQILFPEETDVQLVRVSNELGEFDLSSVQAAVKDRNARIRTIVEFYKENPIPLHVLSTSLGVSVLETLEFLSTQADMRIRCCYGNEQERMQALSALENAQEIVVDLSALATLLLIDRLDVLE